VGAELGAARRGDVVEQPARQLRPVERDARLRRRLAHDPEVLQQELDFESGVEVAADDARAVVRQRPGPARAGPERLEEDGRVEAGGCIVDSASGAVDARLSVQIEKIREVFLKCWEEGIGSVT
jgi:flagellar biosynthesis/type III secretory pathway protein FliH